MLKQRPLWRKNFEKRSKKRSRKNRAFCIEVAWHAPHTYQDPLLHHEPNENEAFSKEKLKKRFKNRKRSLNTKNSKSLNCNLRSGFSDVCHFEVWKFFWRKRLREIERNSNFVGKLESWLESTEFQRKVKKTERMQHQPGFVFRN